MTADGPSIDCEPCRLRQRIAELEARNKLLLKQLEEDRTHFGRDVQATERERCAKVADAMADEKHLDAEFNDCDSEWVGARTNAKKIAAAIRKGARDD
jgi:flagellar motility protein MotE (MotC chaperone)